MGRRDGLTYHRPGTSAGDILCYQRRQRGFTPHHIAQMDGRWTVEDVLRMEDATPKSATDIRRYLDALACLEAGAQLA